MCLPSKTLFGAAACGRNACPPMLQACQCVAKLHKGFKEEPPSFNPTITHVVVFFFFEK